MQDLRLAARALRATPIVSTVAILSLALAIGANTAIFSLVNSLLLRLLPIADPQRLALVSHAARTYLPPYSYSTFEQIRQHGPFDGALAYSAGRSALTIDGERVIVDGLFVSGDFFTTLGVPALLGRTFTLSDDVAGAGANGPVAVISHSLWQERLGGAADIIGSSIIVERVPATVVGVASPEFFGLEVGRTFDVALPIRTQPLFYPSTRFDDDIPWLRIMVRLKPGQSLASSTSALRAVQPQIRVGSMPRTRPAPEFLKDPFTLESAGAGISALRQRFQRPLVTIFAVVALVLLIACANLANLQMARGIGRRPELTVRLALGATRWHLARQLLTESIVMAATGAILGFSFAAWASRAVVAQLSTPLTPVALDLSLDWRVLAFTTATTAATAIIFGIAPALRATRVTPINALKEHGRGSAGPRQAMLSSGLIVAQVALSLMLVIAAGLFVRTFVRLARASLGFDRDRVLVVTVTAPTVPAVERNRFYHLLVSAATAVPGVMHAGGSINPPLVGSLGGDLVVTPPGVKPAPDAEAVSQSNHITPGWLAAYGTVIREGRDIEERDTMATLPVMLVNEAFVRRFLPGQGAVGTTLALTARIQPSGDFPLGSRTIVGVVGDAVYRSIREPMRPTIYLPLAQRDDPLLFTSFFIAVRSSAGSPMLLTRSLDATLKAVNPDLTLTFRPVSEQVNALLAQDRVVAMLSGFFAFLALLLAALGLYGVTAYAVARRRTEIGIRMALGADPAGVITLVLRRVVILVTVGIGAGAVLSWWVAQFVSATVLYGVEARDAATFAMSAAVLAAVGALAGWLPARRASRIDPAEVLREG